MPAQVHLVLDEADLAYLIGLNELDREIILATQSQIEFDAQTRAWVFQQAYHAHARSVDGGNGAGPSRPASTYELDTSMTASVQPNSPGRMEYDQGSNGHTLEDAAEAVSSPRYPGCVGRGQGDELH